MVAPIATALDDPARLHLLTETGLVEASAIARLPTLDRVARLAAHATRSALAQVNLVTANAQVPAAAFVDESRPGPRGAALDSNDADVGGAWRIPVGLDASYCQQIVRSGAPLVIDDAQRDPRVQDSVATTSAAIGAYASVPLLTPGGLVLGSVCVVDFEQRQWAPDDLASLEDCAALAGEEIAARLGASHTIRESEQRFRLAAEAAGLCSWSLDLRTKELMASDAMKTLFGRDTAFGFTQRELFGQICDEDRSRVQQAIAGAAAQGTDYRAEYGITRLDGEPRRIASFGHPIADAEGAPVRIVGLAHDVTDRYLLAAERERLLAAERVARADAEAASRAKTEFLTVMSHELRTPLNAIGGYAELLELGIRGPVSEQQRSDLARIRTSQRQLLRLINEVLNFSKLEMGAVEFARTEIAIRSAVDEAVALVLPQAEMKALDVHVAQAGDSPRVIADADKTSQILVNVLSNAVKFTPPGGRIDLAWATDGDAVTVSIRDSGIGIPVAKLESIFEPFIQVRSDLTRTADGVGLGLAISRELARAMGGELTARSVEREGSTFVLRLPRATQESASTQ